MQITINQQPLEVASSDNLHSILARYCESQRLHLNDLAVARGDSLLPRSSWTGYQPEAGDTFTLFAAVAGG